MEDFINFLSSQGITEIDELACFVQQFLDDPSIFFELSEVEREAVEKKMDQALCVLNR